MGIKTKLYDEFKTSFSFLGKEVGIFMNPPMPDDWDDDDDYEDDYDDKVYDDYDQSQSSLNDSDATDDDEDDWFSEDEKFRVKESGNYIKIKKILDQYPDIKTLPIEEFKRLFDAYIELGNEDFGVTFCGDGCCSDYQYINEDCPDWAEGFEILVKLGRKLRLKMPKIKDYRHGGDVWFYPDDEEDEED